MPRRLFCEISPVTYQISVFKEQLRRYIRWAFTRNFARSFSAEPLPELVYSHESPILRKLGNVDMRLQQNKAVNLSLAAPKVNGILIRPGEVFSFWRLVGNCTASKGYKPGLLIGTGGPTEGVGGGMCGFTNLLHWVALHSPLKITEHHHHNEYDLFPDSERQIPFGTGTSILYNYLDYQLRNDTDNTFQFLVWAEDDLLHCELRAEKTVRIIYEITEEEQYFVKQGSDYYRHNRVTRRAIDKESGNEIDRVLLIENHAKVMYDSSFIRRELIRN